MYCVCLLTLAHAATRNRSATHFQTMDRVTPVGRTTATTYGEKSVCVLEREEKRKREIDRANSSATIFDQIVAH